MYVSAVFLCLVGEYRKEFTNSSGCLCVRAGLRETILRAGESGSLPHCSESSKLCFNSELIKDEFICR